MKKLFASIALCQSAGIVGSIFTVSTIPGWYALLNKPFFSPPNWLFGPAWITLYALMGVAFYLVWSSGADQDKKYRAMTVFLVHLFFNAIWSIIFFGLQSIGGALIMILFLWFAILATIITFHKISRPAAWLLVPYILWVSFAIYLNYSIWILN